jgi:hypothetical protein
VDGKLTKIATGGTDQQKAPERAKVGWFLDNQHFMFFKFLGALNYLLFL